jgi:hypothetical protein
MVPMPLFAKYKQTKMLEEYTDKITYNCYNKLKTLINNEPVLKLKNKDDIIKIPTTKTIDEFIKYSYNMSQLKLIAKYYNLKLTGNKSDLNLRIFSYLYFSLNASKIQKIFRGLIVRKYILFHGPAAKKKKRENCTNTEDFITMDPICDIDFHQMFSYKDVDNFIYGFNICSLYNLILKSKNKPIYNPYNRNIIPNDIIENIKSIVKISNILKMSLTLSYEDDTENLSLEKTVEMRALTLFQNIDALGNYSDYNWFLSLTRNQLIKFIRELCEIWNYRAQISYTVKRNIIPPLGDPFHNLNIIYISTEPNIHNIKKVILEILERFVNSGIDKDSQTLGAYYVLGALTLVNESAAMALPWLFQSFEYI